MMRSLIIPQRQAIDDEWYGRLTIVAKYTPEIYSWLGPTAVELRRLRKTYEQGDRPNRPNLRPDDKMCAKIVAEKQALMVLLSDVQQREQNTIIRDAYSLRIQELVDNASLYEAALLGDSTEFNHLNRAIYGQPNVSIFESTCDWYRSNAVSWAKEDHRLIQHAQRVLDVLPRPAGAATQSALKPSDKAFDMMRAMHVHKGGLYPQLFADVTIPDTGINEKHGEVVLHKILKNLGADDYDVRHSSDPYWGLRFSTKSVVCPANYDLTALEFKAIVGHEIGSHLVERLNGLRQPLRLLAFGLQGYEKGNEGRALIREQVLYSSWSQFENQRRWHEILARHLVISLAAGIDGTARTFDELYGILKTICLLWERKASDTTETDESIANRAHAMAWQLLTRVLNGTDQTGSVYLKDIVYLEGNIACWRKAALHPDSIALGDLGKLNIANVDHMALLESIRSW